MTKHLKKFGHWSALLALALATAALPIRAAAQDDQGDDPPTRVARLGYMEGSVSFQPAGEQDWVQAVANRPMTTGDKLWADKGSRAELQLGSAVIRLSENTGFSFLNLDDHTAQIQLTSGTLNLRVRRLDQGDAYEVDTPNLAFTVDGPGNYRLEASEDGTYSVVSLRDGQGEATGNGQTYTIHAGQRATFNGTDSLNADVESNNSPDQFDTWGDGRDHRYDDSRSAHYLSHDVVGYEDLDDNGDWRDDSNYGHVWYPNHVDAGWAPYHEGHWDWISPWGYTWVDDSNWGYAPFHYGRWVSVSGRWGWVAGPVDVAAVYAPALVVFLGGGPGGFGGNVGWFPLGPREVYVPPYQVSRGYMNQVNISNTTVNTTVVTNVYNTTIVNKSTTITNVNYANRGVQGAVTVVPQRAFAGAQPVAHSAVAMNQQQLAAVPVAARVAVAPTRESVLGAKASSAGHVSAPPAAVANRQVIAKRTPPPPPVPFAKQQQAMAAHPGQPLPKREMQSLRPAAAAAHPMVKQAPPGKPAQATTGHPMNAGRPGQPGQPAPNQPANRPGQPAPNERPGAANQPNRPNEPANRPGQPAPNERPGAAPAQPNRPPANEANRPGAAPQRDDRPPSAQQPAGRPEANRPAAQPNRPEPAQPNRPSQPEPARPQANRPAEPPAQNNRPAAQPNRPEPAQPNRPSQPEPARPQANRPAEPPAQNNRPAAQPNRPEPAQPNRPAQPEPARPQANRPAEPPAQNNRPAAQPNRPAAQPNRPEPKPAEPAARPQTPPPAQRAPERTPPPAQHAAPPAERTPPPAQHAAPPAERTPPPAAKPAPAPAHPPAKTPQEKKQEEDKKKPPVG